jgi:hypothetical protein
MWDGLSWMEGEFFMLAYVSHRRTSFFTVTVQHNQSYGVYGVLISSVRLRTRIRT